jgi:ATP-dependent Lon protease
VESSLVVEALGTSVEENLLLSERIASPGTAFGLAYTASGGRALLVETTNYPGTGRLILTGQLGDVMKESIGTSLSWIRANSAKLGIKPICFDDFDLHVHFPAAAIPKDGPSAGVTITVALVSLLTARRVKQDFAMSGELSLQGLVLPVGGIKEKCMAAHRNQIKNVILPKQNEQDTREIPDDIRRNLQIHLVSSVVEALQLALDGEADSQFLKQEVLPFFRAKL